MKVAFLNILLVCTVFTQTNVDNCFKSINSDDFYLFMETKDVLIIDVRLNKDFRKERIDGAILASEREALLSAINQVDKNKYILVYCDKGYKSKTAAQIICSELNFKNIYSLQGGINTWKQEGYPTNKEKINIP